MSEVEAAGTRVYRRPQRADWYLSRPSYFLYMVRELTVVFMVAWLAWFLYQTALLKQGAFTTLTGNYAALAFSLVCLFFTLWHALTFLNLSGLILRLPMGDRFAAPIVVKVVSFSGLVLATLLGGAVMIWIGYLHV